MDILDFDNTIYKGDSFIDILKFATKKRPFLMMGILFGSIKLFKQYKKGIIGFEIVKEKLLSFLPRLKNKDKFIEEFTNKKIKNIKKWYLDKNKDKDIIITASCEMWVKPICDKIGVKHVIGTVLDENYKIVGKNCKREEKIIRLNKEFPNIEINTAYSDSKSDLPMFEVAKNGIVVEGNNLIPYKKDYLFKELR